ncbi:hypothetical protein FHY31_004211 [Xanthomonas euvesicatoria]|uniref:Transposase n=1 Tax=Xanthomonas euvesicatoria TaxID=456327 RepID=A0AAW3UB11_XANEU|nr:hypothetical protein [Xanthomonas euvesicatoria]MBB4872392.1 hypothetical protein [Xanthomonas euvesicatoria]
MSHYVCLENWPRWALSTLEGLEQKRVSVRSAPAPGHACRLERTPDAGIQSERNDRDDSCSYLAALRVRYSDRFSSLGRPDRMRRNQPVHAENYGAQESRVDRHSIAQSRRA